MHYSVVTLFPELVAAGVAHGVLGRGFRSGRLTLSRHDPRGWARDRHGTVDDRPYGGGPGMLMQSAPLRSAVAQARVAAPPGAPVVFLGPGGAPFDQALAQVWAEGPGLVLVCGRYEGVDERVLAEVDHEVSIGDYVLSGGEFAALVVIDAVSRLVPGVLGDTASAAADSFGDGLLEGPQYTRPPSDERGVEVPPVLLSGDHGAIERWRRGQALLRTWQRRPDLLLHRRLDAGELALLAQSLAEHAGSGSVPGAG